MLLCWQEERMKPQEVARWFGISSATLHRWIYQGKVTPLVDKFRGRIAANKNWQHTRGIWPACHRGVINVEYHTRFKQQRRNQ
jgi:hypothetical protein